MGWMSRKKSTGASSGGRSTEPAPPLPAVPAPLAAPPPMPAFAPEPGSAASLMRHRWSLPLSVLASVCFARLASELQEGELGPFDRFGVGLVVPFRGHYDRPMLWLTRLGAGWPMVVVTVVTTAAMLLRKR